MSKITSIKTFEEYYKEYNKAIYMYAYRLTDNAYEAEELTAYCFNKLWEKRETINNSKHVKNFLFMTMRNKALNRRRDAKRANTSLCEYGRRMVEQELITSFEIEKIHIELINLVQRELEQLPNRSQKIITMLYIEGKKIKEVAQTLKVSIETIYKEREKSLNLMKNHLVWRGINNT